MLILSCVCMKLIQNQFVKYYKPIVGETWGNRIRQKTISCQCLDTSSSVSGEKEERRLLAVGVVGLGSCVCGLEN